MHLAVNRVKIRLMHTTQANTPTGPDGGLASFHIWRHTRSMVGTVVGGGIAWSSRVET